jgi:hypothetical protein
MQNTKVSHAQCGTVVAQEQSTGFLRRKRKDAVFRAPYCIQDLITSGAVTFAEEPAFRKELGI